MFSGKKRLKRTEFSSIIKIGRRAISPNFSVIVSKNSEGYAVVVSKKVARLSVTRHRIKRRVLEAMKTLSLPQSLVVFPKSSVAGMEYKDIQAELAGLLSKIR